MTATPFPAYEGEEPFFFVSYAHDDDAMVFEEMAWLGEHQRLWYDDGIHVGAVWRRAIADALDRCSGLIFFCTERATASEHCTKEINFALDRGKPIFVVQLDDAPMPSELQLSLSDRQALIRSQYQDAAYRERLTNALAQVVPPRTPVFADPSELIKVLLEACGRQPSPDEAMTIEYAVDLLIEAGMRKGAESVHLDVVVMDSPHPSGRFGLRVDGVIWELATYDADLHDALVTRVREKAFIEGSPRAPQTGRIRIPISRERSIDARVQTMPTIWGECLTLTFLSTASLLFAPRQLGLSEHDEDRIQAIIELTSGFVLFTGPMRQGKSVTAATIAVRVADERRLIFVDEPGTNVTMPGVIQTLAQGAEYPFEVALTTAIDSGPDVLFVDEVHDQSTLRRLLETSGSRLVLTTMRHKDAISAWAQLRRWDLDRKLEETTALVVAQRLLRRLCMQCRQPATLSDLERALLNQVSAFNGVSTVSGSFFQAQGCAQCHQGYSGRVGVFETAVQSPQLMRALREDQAHEDLRLIAINEGMQTMMLEGIRLAAAGVTDIAEVRRALGDLLRMIP